MPRLHRIVELLENEPLEILQAIDNTPRELKRKLFPNLTEFAKSRPTDIVPLLVSGIRTAKIVKTDKVKNIDYNRLEHSGYWNRLAILYMSNGRFGKAKAVFEAMLAVGASDSSTITNYGAVLLNEMIAADKFDEENFTVAKEHTYRAFSFDVPKKGLLYKGVLMPAFKNLVIIRNIEAEHFFNKGDLFTSFILGWISIEMSLLRIWSRFLELLKYSEGKREDMIRWDIGLIIEVLSIVKVVMPDMKNYLESLRGIRNSLVHGTQIYPTKGEIKRCIEVGRMLVPLLQ